MTDFDSFYVTWYSRALHFACGFVASEADAENIVQDVFLRLYERRECFDMPVNLTAYLFTSIKNKCLEHLRKEVIERNAYAIMQNEFEQMLRIRRDSLEILNMDFPDEASIEERLNKALEVLPERCRQIFIMNKLEGKKHSQIADELQLSVKTVEAQMTIAYKKLREELKDCLPLFAFLFTLS